MGKQQNGTTLSHLAGVVVVVMVISGLLPPLLAKDSDPGEAVAHYDTRDIGLALIQFHENFGVWPNQNAQGEAALPTLLGGNGGGHPSLDATGLIAHHPMANQPPGQGYPDHDEPAWQGPYVEGLPLDPWGHPYMVNMNALADDPPVGANKAVVLSSGPNGRLETPLVMDRGTRFGGDDIGMAFFVRDDPAADAVEMLTSAQGL